MGSCRSSDSSYSDTTHQNPSNSGGGGVCMMSTKWRDEQHPSFNDFISSFLTANSFRLSFILIALDLIFNCEGLSVSFVFVTNWDFNDNATIFNRYGMQLGRPTFVPVQDIEMGFEKMVNIAHCRGRGRKSYSPKLFGSINLFK